MRTATVVIGACFGDEGKGRVVDHLVNQTDGPKLVVRFNGGAQAAHNVVLPDGRSHIHQHFSSGALSGHFTYLDRHFICNPRAFLQEREALHIKTLAALKPCFVHPQAIVTTPFDIFLNQAAETARSGTRHGSCGVGIGETVERYAQRHDPAVIQIHDWLASGDRRKTVNYLTTLRDAWLPRRIAQLGIDLGEHRGHPIFSDTLIDRHTDELEAFASAIKIADRHAVTSRFHDVVFEGAQGLMLDQDYGRNAGFFPHVTRSNTGMKNVAEFLGELDWHHSADIHYITRSYMTRHGSGPFPSEATDTLLELLDTKGETNVRGEFQGSLRYGFLDLRQLWSAIQFDRGYFPSSFQLDITCLDQWRGDPIIIDLDGNRRCGPIDKYLDAFKAFGMRDIWTSRSNRRPNPAINRAAA